MDELYAEVSRTTRTRTGIALMGYLPKIIDKLNEMPATSDVVTKVMVSQETLDEIKRYMRDSGGKNPTWKGVEILNSGPRGPFVRLYADGRIVEEVVVEVEIFEAAE